MSVCAALLPAAASAQRPVGGDTATYATPALRALVAEAARGNRIPDSLASYRAAVETEITASVRREDGLEAVFSVEQIASVLRWTRAGYYDQHVLGDRTRQSGLSLSVLSVLRTGWIAPVLYGNRFRLRRDEEQRPRPADTTKSGTTKSGTKKPGTPGTVERTIDKLEARVAGRGSTIDTTQIVHPLATDRDRYYRYTGGDTVVTLRTSDGTGARREIPIVRVHVEPRVGVTARTGLFAGDVDLDATTRAVVRLRGRLLLARERPGRSLLARARDAITPKPYAYIEDVNAERSDAAGRRYWLPATQRGEAQVTAAALGDARVVVRVVSRFRDVVVNDTALTPAELAANADSILPVAPRALTLARGDSLGRYGAWRAPLGTATGDLRADDFDDLAPTTAGVTGPPAVGLFYPRLSDLVRYNRVEGLFTGLGGRVRFRDAAPGLRADATAGYAWAERTVRGRVEVEQKLGRGARTAPAAGAPGALAVASGAAGSGGAWALVGRAGRTLDITNDFRAPFDSGSSLGAVLGADDYDYVDRRFATVGVARASSARVFLFRADVGAAEDRGDGAHVHHALFSRVDFRPNRGVDEGRYLRTSATLEYHPDVAAEFVRPGLGARLYAERGDGGLRYTRVAGRLVGRRDLVDGATGRFLGLPLTGSTLALVGRVDAGLVAAPADRGPPPQQLFELGRAQSLLGYGYKEFAGDRAASLRTTLLYTGPFLRAPFRVRRFILPAPAPGLAAGVQLGYAEASDAAALRSITRLGFRNDTTNAAGFPVLASRPTNGVRASVSLGATLFGGAVFAGVAKAVDAHADRPRGIRALVTFNQPL